MSIGYPRAKSFDWVVNMAYRPALLIRLYKIYVETILVYQKWYIILKDSAYQFDYRSTLTYQMWSKRWLAWQKRKLLILLGGWRLERSNLPMSSPARKGFGISGLAMRMFQQTYSDLWIQYQTRSWTWKIQLPSFTIVLDECFLQWHGLILWGSKY